MMTINGMEYSEAEYTDQPHPHPVWGLLKPLWGASSINVRIAMYETDNNDHKDERMDISPGTRSDLVFGIDPANGRLLNLPNGCKATASSIGGTIDASGAGRPSHQAVRHSVPSNVNGFHG